MEKLPTAHAKVLRAHNYTYEATLSDTRRNAVHKVSRDGRQFVAKFNVAKEPIALENDVWWMLTMRRLVDGDSPLIAPSVYEYGSGWFIAEYIDAPLVASATASKDELSARLDLLVDLLGWLDGVLQPRKLMPLYDDSDSARYHDLLRKVDEWMEQPLEQKLITPEQISGAKRIIDEHKSHITPSLQHGDFMPDHMFQLADGRVSLFDGEHAGLMKPRYYDLAYLYTRLFTRFHAPELADRLLQTFVDRHTDDPDVFFKAYLPAVTLRAFGMFPDALAEVSYNDYTAEAQELMERCRRQELL